MLDRHEPPALRLMPVAGLILCLDDFFATVGHAAGGIAGIDDELGVLDDPGVIVRGVVGGDEDAQRLLGGAQGDVVQAGLFLVVGGVAGRRRSEEDKRGADLVCEGFAGTEGRVAEEALVSRATAYRYFPSVDALLVEAPLDGATPNPDELFRDGTHAAKRACATTQTRT